jgi:hypothetical protein
MQQGSSQCDHEYVFLIGHGLHIRVQLWFADHRTETFVIALELEWARDDWRRVASIDSFGGVVHRDRYRPDGRHHARQEPIFHSDDPDQAADWATTHLMERVSRYVTEFRQRDE